MWRKYTSQILGNSIKRYYKEMGKDTRLGNLHNEKKEFAHGRKLQEAQRNRWAGQYLWPQ